MNHGSNDPDVLYHLYMNANVVTENMLEMSTQCVISMALSCFSMWYLYGEIISITQICYYNKGCLT